MVPGGCSSPPTCASSEGYAPALHQSYDAAVQTPPACVPPGHCVPYLWQTTGVRPHAASPAPRWIDADLLHLAILALRTRRHDMHPLLPGPYAGGRLRQAPLCCPVEE